LSAVVTVLFLLLLLLPSLLLPLLLQPLQHTGVQKSYNK